MRRRSTVCFILAAAAVFAPLSVVASCSSSPQLAGLAQGCSINSDCNAPLICAFTRCHEQCAATRDCPAGETCVSSGKDNVCQLFQESTCSPTTSCPEGLVCSSAETCRNPCTVSTDCTVAGQQCQAGVCQDPSTGSDAAGDSPGDGTTPGTDASGDATPADGALSSDAPPSSDAPTDAGVDAPVDACVLPPDGGPLGYSPSNFDPTALSVADGGVPDAGDAASIVSGGVIDWADAPDVNIAENCTRACLPQPIVVTMVDGSQAALYAMHSLTVQSAITLDLNAGQNTTLTLPIIFAVLTTADIQGTIEAGSHLYVPGPGAFPSPGGETPEGPGGGGDGLVAPYTNSAPSGGSYCGIGGRGGFTAPPQALAGGVYGNPRIVPLAAGSGGGLPGSLNFGAGGGAIQISAGVSITVRAVGVIDVAGGGGSIGGGGSGGAILLEAPTVTIDGTLTANGGGGGAIGAGGNLAGDDGAPDGIAAPGGIDDTTGGAGSAGATINGGAGGVATEGGVAYGAGGGGAGYIRINSTCAGAVFGVNATLTPDLTTPCATQGALTP